MGRTKGSLGKKTVSERSISSYLQAHQSKIPQLLAELTALALKLQTVKCPNCNEYHDVKGGGNIVALKYLLDRHYGTAPQSIKVEAKALVLTGDDYSRISVEIKEAERLLLKGLPVLTDPRMAIEDTEEDDAI